MADQDACGEGLNHLEVESDAVGDICNPLEAGSEGEDRNKGNNI